MRKETSVAIVIGVIFGLVVAFGVWRANRAMNGKTAAVIESGPEETPIPTNLQKEGSEDQSFITLPPENFVSSEKTLTVSGKTTPNSAVIISTQSKDSIFLSDVSGSFSKEIELNPGLNQIGITSFDKSLKPTSEKRLAVYSDIDFKSVENEASAEDRIGKRLDQVANYPIAYMGVVTDKTDNSIQIKNTEGLIQLVATTEDTSYFQETTTKKKITFTDVAIGDFILALGIEDKKAVLNTKSISVISPIKEPTRKVVAGQTVSKKGKTINITDNSNIEWVIKFPVKWDGPELSEINPGSTVVIVGEPDADIPEEITARTSFLVLEANSPTPSTKTTSSPAPTKKVTPTTTVKLSPTKKPTPTSSN